ncbi:MAG: hypothetical protein HY951_08960 [Bacteroidia bacterium]|nr:hypothetical protein [Bacteroidia bacterium]
MNQNEKISHIIETLNEATALIANNNCENINNIDKDLALGKIRMAYDFLLKVETKETAIKIEEPKKIIEKEIKVIPVEEKPVVEIIEKEIINQPVEKSIEKVQEIKTVEPIVIEEEKKIEEIQAPVQTNITVTQETSIEKKQIEKVVETKTTISTGSKTIADQYQETKAKTLSESLTKTVKDFSTTQQLKPIKNLKSAISINDRVMFMRDIFSNDSAKYTETIDKINEMSNLDEAMEFINKTLNFKTDSDSFNKFLELIYRRFAGSSPIE